MEAVIGRDPRDCKDVESLTEREQPLKPFRGSVPLKDRPSGQKWA
jgi:hypothetical protein